jgi:hypothetical protein
MDFWKFMLKSQLARSGTYLDNTAKTMLRKKLSIIQFWLQDHAWFQNYSEADVWTKKKKRGATNTGTKEGRNRRETSTGTQPEAGGTSKSMKEENPCPGEERKRETSIGTPPGTGTPARTKSNQQIMMQKNRFLRKEKRERKKKRKAPNPQTQPAEVNKS